MAYSTFKDFDKCVTDLLDDDFDSKFSLKVKSSGPANTTITTNTQLDCKTNKLVPKLTTKWVHASGFTLEKLEFSSDCKTTVETSLSNLTPGLKLEFKGNECDKADVSVTYALPIATMTGEFDINNFSSVKASVNGGQGPFTLGASADLKIAKSAVESTTFNVGAGYTIPKQAFFGFRANKNFADFSGLFSYILNKDTSLAAVVSHGTKGVCATALASYRCNPDTVIKAKVNTCGVFSASVKQAFEKKFTVVGSAEIPSDFNAVKFGINATLG
jgi:hypothetical protein